MSFFIPIGYLINLQQLNPRLSSEKLQEYNDASIDWSYPEAEFKAIQRNEHNFYIQHGGHEEKTLYIGDSFMQQYSTRINKVIIENPEKSNTAVFSTRGSCPPLLDVEHRGNAPINCKNFMEETMSYIYSTPEIKRVVIAASWAMYFTKDKNDYLIKNESVNTKFSDLEKTLKLIKSQGKEVTLVGLFPQDQLFDPNHLFSRVNANHKIDNELQIPTEKYNTDQNLIITQRLKDIARRNDIEFIEPVKHLCEAKKCFVLDQSGKPRYRDAAHLSASYSRNNMLFLDHTVIITH